MIAAAAPSDPNSLGQQFAAAGRALATEPLTEAMGACVHEAMENVAHNFDTSAAASGAPWKERKHVGDGHPLLIDTGRMISGALGPDVSLSSLARLNSYGMGEHVRTIEAREASVEVTTPYAGAHMEGTARMPARPFYEVDGEAADKMADIVADAALEKVMEALGAN